MIAKKITNPKKSATKSARATGLANYIVEPERKNGVEKCIHHEAKNFLTSAHDARVAEMIALSSESVKSKDPIDHWVLSWRSDERPTIEQAREAVDIFIKQCGLVDHQLIWGLHDDTNNLHVHIQVNRVHPDSLKVVKINKGFDREAGQQAAALIEHAQGWQPEKGSRYQIVNGKPVMRDGKDKNKPLEPSTKAQDMEVQTGEKSAQRIGIEEAAPIITTARTWRELHDGLTAIGMRYKRKGSGAVIHVGDVVVKASDVARAASLSTLQKKLGAYQPPQEILQNEYHHHHTTQSHPTSPGEKPGHGLRSLSECRLATYKEGKQTNRAGVLQIASRPGRRADDGLRRSAGRGRGDRATGTSTGRANEGLRIANGGRNRAANERQQPHITKPVKANQPGWSEYQIIKSERKTAKDAAVLLQKQKQEAERDALFENHKAARNDLFKSSSWNGRGALRNAMQSVLANEQAAEKFELRERQRAARTELQAQHTPLPQYKQWKEQPQIVAEEVQLHLIQSAMHKQQPQQLSQLLRSLSHSMDLRGYVTYKTAGVSIFRDEGKTLAVLNQSSSSLACALAHAQQKFGQTLTLTGSDEYKHRCVAAAIDHNLSIKFADPNLEAMRVKMAEGKRLAERETQQAARAAAQTKAKKQQDAEHRLTSHITPQPTRPVPMAQEQAQRAAAPTVEPTVELAISRKKWIAQQNKPMGEPYRQASTTRYTVLFVDTDGVVVSHGKRLAAY